MTRVYRSLLGGLALAALTVGLVAPARADDQRCAQAMRLQAQGLSLGEIAHALGMSVDDVRGLCAAPRSAPAGRAAVGAAGPAPVGAAGPAPMGAAGPAPMGAAGPAPMGAARGGATSVKPQR
jgi:hypothetical protein